MSERQQIIEAMRAAGVEDAGKPRVRSYTNPRHVEPVEEPEQPDTTVEEMAQPIPAKSTSTRPIPTGEQHKRPTPVGGTDPYRIEVDHRREARETADRVLARLSGQNPTPTFGDSVGGI